MGVAAEEVPRHVRDVGSPCNGDTVRPALLCQPKQLHIQGEIPHIGGGGKHGGLLLNAPMDAYSGLGEK